MPLFVVFMGIICQAFIAYFITFPQEYEKTKKNVEMQHVSQTSHANPDLKTEVNSNCGCCSACKKTGNSIQYHLYDIITI